MVRSSGEILSLSVVGRSGETLSLSVVGKGSKVGRVPGRSQLCWLECIIKQSVAVYY